MNYGKLTSHHLKTDFKPINKDWTKMRLKLFNRRDCCYDRWADKKISRKASVDHLRTKKLTEKNQRAFRSLVIRTHLRIIN